MTAPSVASSSPTNGHTWSCHLLKVSRGRAPSIEHPSPKMVWQHFAEPLLTCTVYTTANHDSVVSTDTTSCSASNGHAAPVRQLRVLIQWMLDSVDAVDTVLLARKPSSSTAVLEDIDIISIVRQSWTLQDGPVPITAVHQGNMVCIRYREATTTMWNRFQIKFHSSTDKNAFISLIKADCPVLSAGKRGKDNNDKYQLDFDDLSQLSQGGETETRENHDHSCDQVTLESSLSLGTQTQPDDQTYLPMVVYPAVDVSLNDSKHQHGSESVDQQDVADSKSTLVAGLDGQQEDEEISDDQLHRIQFTCQRLALDGEGVKRLLDLLWKTFVGES